MCLKESVVAIFVLQEKFRIFRSSTRRS